MRTRDVHAAKRRPRVTGNLEEKIPQAALAAYRVNRYIRNHTGTLCADIIVHDPITGKRLRKQVTSKSSEEALQVRITAAMENLYLEIRPAFLKCSLVGGELTLKHYLSLDLAFLRAGFPKAFGNREITSLLQYADAFDTELSQCKSADDFLPVLRGLNLNRELELTVLRMVSDALNELLTLGILAHNPLSTYLCEARKNANRAKAEQREHKNSALPTYAAAAILAEYDRHILEDARYFAVPLCLLGIPASTISALDLNDIIDVCNVLSLRVDSEMVRPGVRLCERPLESVWQVRMLCVDFMRKEIDAWQEKYLSMGLDPSVGKIPLCAHGRRKNPKRCSPEEIDGFLKALLDRCHPGSHPFAARTYHKTFLLIGDDVLAKKPLHARYLLGQAPETVDERVYISFTSPRLQREMSDMVDAIFECIRKGDYPSRVAV